MGCFNRKLKIARSNDLITNLRMVLIDWVFNATKQLCAEISTDDARALMWKTAHVSKVYLPNIAGILGPESADGARGNRKVIRVVSVL